MNDETTRELLWGSASVWIERQIVTKPLHALPDESLSNGPVSSLRATSGRPARGLELRRRMAEIRPTPPELPLTLPAAEGT